MLSIERFSFGVGDRFAHQASAQLRAFQQMERTGCLVVPVWNKSNREHSFIGSEPQSVQSAAKAAVEQLGWSHGWYVDADHIRLETVDRFLGSSNFFTIDVADSIGRPASDSDLSGFLARHPELLKPIMVVDIDAPLALNRDRVVAIAQKYLAAAQDAGRIYRHIASKKGAESFVAEVSMDETDEPQTPGDLLVILAALADEKIPLQTIAPKFTGRFNKGVDYVGPLDVFEKEFNDDLAILKHASATYGLPNNLKLSVHSGSDKFSLYPIINRALKKSGAGLHIKTAGTTWLEELIGLSEAGGDGLALVKELYATALEKRDELAGPYASVIDINPSQLPSLATTQTWSSEEWVHALQHVPNHPQYNASVRQLMHVSFKLAAKQGTRYTDLLKQNADIVGRNVYENIFHRHMEPLFAGL